jgi:hypothetical protein
VDFGRDFLISMKQYKYLAHPLALERMPGGDPKAVATKIFRAVRIEHPHLDRTPAQSLGDEDPISPDAKFAIGCALG